MTEELGSSMGILLYIDDASHMNSSETLNYCSETQLYLCSVECYLVPQFVIDLLPSGLLIHGN